MGAIQPTSLNLRLVWSTPSSILRRSVCESVETNAGER